MSARALAAMIAGAMSKCHTHGVPNVLEHVCKTYVEQWKRSLVEPGGETPAQEQERMAEWERHIVDGPGEPDEFTIRAFDAKTGYEMKLSTSATVLDGPIFPLHGEARWLFDKRTGDMLHTHMASQCEPPAIPLTCKGFEAAIESGELKVKIDEGANFGYRGHTAAMAREREIPGVKSSYSFGKTIDRVEVGDPPRIVPRFVPRSVVTMEFTNHSGFLRGSFTDQSDMSCRIQESPLETEPGLLLGRAGESMHLTQAMVAELIPLLQRFVETGGLTPNAVAKQGDDTQAR